ncbi:MAG TPA: hypothetical protein VFW69_20590, partial [Mycobacterium sp.]|nr:hypothetical protein [Mycobacterium sp.]
MFTPEGVQVCEECSERAVVWRDRGGVDVFARTVLTVSADTEDNGGNASLPEKTRVGRTMFTDDVGSISLV